jgi:hypothetical protein
MTLATAALAPAYHPGSWSTFFALTGAAAATLTGLFFVAFSLRVRELQRSRVLRTRARHLLIWLIVITISSGFVVMPAQSLAVLAAEIPVVSVGCVAYTVWSVCRTARYPGSLTTAVANNRSPVGLPRETAPARPSLAVPGRSGAATPDAQHSAGEPGTDRLAEPAPFRRARR